MLPNECTNGRSRGLAKRFGCLALAATVVIHTSSCGLFVSGHQSISLNTDPPGAEVKMDGIPQGVTPMSLRVSRRDEPIFLFEKEGYQTLQKATERRPNTYFILDIIGGVLILVPFLGLLGAGDWDVEPGNISVLMQPKKADAAAVTKYTTVPTTVTTENGSMTVQIKLDSEEVRPGDRLKVTVLMKPTGQNPDTPPSCEIYIHRDDKDLKQQTATARLNSDGNYEAQTEFQLPTLLKEGSYEVRVVVPPNTTAMKTLTVNQ